MGFDMGKGLQDAYSEGYEQALLDLIEKAQAELTLVSWYSKGSIIAFIKRFAEGD